MPQNYAGQTKPGISNPLSPWTLPASAACQPSPSQLPMRQEVVFCPWAATTLLLLLCESSTLSMAFSVHNTRHIRSSSHAFHFQIARFQADTVPSVRFNEFSIASKRRLRRSRTSLYHFDATERSASPTPPVQPPASLATAMDKALPFGRCIGVALPLALNEETVRAATKELMQEEMAYCFGLPPALQVG